MDIFSHSRIGLIFNRKELEINLQDWNKQKYPILVITGIAGSGKTYLAQKIALKYDVEYISFDSLKFYSSATKTNKKMVDEFLLLYPNVHKYVYSNFKYFNDASTDDKMYTYYSALFLNYLISKAIQENKLYVVEGIHFFMRFPLSIINGRPLIVVRISLINSIFRKIQREYFSGDNEYRKKI